MILPILCFVLIFYCALGSHDDWRDAFLTSAIVWGVTLAAMTESLSLLHWVTRAALLLVWAVLALVVGTVAWRRRSLALPHLRGASPRRLDVGIIVVICVLAATTAMIAILAPPNNWDSMVYHMSRVMHWAQNRSVAYYPTNILAQIRHDPWAEYAILHFFLLADGDRLSNLVQWFSMLGSVIGVSLIARHLGANGRGQLLSALFCATLPMGILQASSTQTDYAAAFWLVCLAYGLLALPFTTRLAAALFVGASLGLALFTKETSFIFAAPIVVLIALPRLVRSCRSGQKQCLRYAAFGLLLAVALNGGRFLRNLDLFGTLLPETRLSGGYAYTNDEISLPIFASNIVRNLGLHLALPAITLDSAHQAHVVEGVPPLVRRFLSAPIWARINARVEHAVDACSVWLLNDASDPRNTWGDTKFQVIFTTHEDSAGNLPHFFCIITIVGLGLVGAWRRARPIADKARYGAALVAGFLLFCLLLRWQPWHSRLQLPLFVLWAPLFGVYAQRLGPRRQTLLVLILSLWAVPFLVANASRPLLGAASVFRASRIDQLFHNRPDVEPAYRGAAEYLHSIRCSRIGFVGGDGLWEYPFWELLPEVRMPGGRFEHVAVDNVSASLRPRPFRPCAVVVLGGEPVRTLQIDARQYREAWSQAPVRVFLPERR